MTTPSVTLASLSFDAQDLDYVQKLKDLVFYVQQNDQVAQLVLSGVSFEGGHDASGNAYPVSPPADSFYLLTAGGTLGGDTMSAGDFIIYTGGAWVNRPYGVGALLASNNLSDLANASAARTNLGLGNVDNTADTAKPVSTTQQAAIDAVEALAQFSDYDQFTSSGTWTKHANSTWVYVEAIGGGGGGGNTTTTVDRGGGGGGGFNSGLFLAADLGATETVTVGAGGAGGANGGNNTGADGGDSTFGSHLTGRGGVGGGSSGGDGGGYEKGQVNTSATPQSGYSSGGGSLDETAGNTIKGGAGGGGTVNAARSGGVSLDGGSGGAGVTTASTPGGAGSQPGGGGGASSNDGGGGAGGAGRVRVWQW